MKHGIGPTFQQDARARRRNGAKQSKHNPIGATARVRVRMGLLVNLASRDAMGAGRARADATSGLMTLPKRQEPPSKFTENPTRSNGLAPKLSLK